MKTTKTTANVLERVGNTPLITLENRVFPNLNLYAKLEYFNPTGSVKDRAAHYILNKCLQDGTINRDTTIIESSSGNFGVALSAYCKHLGLKFICVIDPNISPTNEMLIESFGAQLIKVTQMDRNGGYLISRLEMIEKLQRELSNVYWINQYANPLNAEAYYQSLGTEICNAFPDELHYVFLGVSSGGTITGLSRKIKERFPRARVVAVDIYGSVIFGHQPAKRVIPGIGSSIVPPILQRAHIDEVVLVSELETILQCRELVEQQYIFAGGSSGSVYAALKKYFSRLPPGPRQNVVCIFPDRGERYCSTIYDNRWYNDFILKCAGMRHAAESPAQLELQNQ